MRKETLRWNVVTVPGLVVRDWPTTEITDGVRRNATTTGLVGQDSSVPRSANLGAAWFQC